MIDILGVVGLLGLVIASLEYSICFWLCVPFSFFRKLILRIPNVETEHPRLFRFAQKYLDLPYVLCCKYYADTVLRSLGIEVRYVEEEDRKRQEEINSTEDPKVVVYQHICIADPCLTAHLFPKVRFIMKSSLKVIFTIYPAAVYCGYIPVERSSKSSRGSALAALMSAVKEKHDWIAVAPEGTRNTSGNGQLLPFKHGAFIVACENNKPVVPVIHFGANNIFPPGKLPRHGVIRVKILDPIYPKVNKETGEVTETPEELTERVRDIMQEAINSVKLPEDAFHRTLFQKFCSWIPCIVAYAWPVLLGLYIKYH